MLDTYRLKFSARSEDSLLFFNWPIKKTCSIPSTQNLLIVRSLINGPLLSSGKIGPPRPNVLLPAVYLYVVLPNPGFFQDRTKDHARNHSLRSGFLAALGMTGKGGEGAEALFIVIQRKRERPKNLDHSRPASIIVMIKILLS